MWRTSAVTDRVILGLQFEPDLLPANGHTLGIELVNGETDTVLIILAEMGLRAGQRRGMADAHRHFSSRGLRAAGRLFGLLAAGAEGDGGGQHAQCQGLFHGGILSGSNLCGDSSKVPAKLRNFPNRLNLPSTPVADPTGLAPFFTPVTPRIIRLSGCLPPSPSRSI